MESGALKAMMQLVLFKLEDATFREIGAVGVWTKAGSVTLLDDFTFGSQ